MTIGRTLAFAAAGLVFALLATANAAGYRYGGSDQAFYVPVITRALEPLAFPRDGALIDAQGALIVVDDVLAAAQRVTGLSTGSLFFAGYMLSLALTWAGIAAIGTTVYGSFWTTCALGAAFTLRHRISMTSANTFEPYFHPRMLAFALGLLAVAAMLRRRAWLAVALVGIAAVVHTTTALWFAVLLGIALAIVDRRFTRLAWVAGGGAAILLAWGLTLGPLRGAWVVMDAVWLQAVASKDSLFADQWPLWAWFVNLGTLGLLWLAHRVRQRRGSATHEDRALVWGATALVGVFLLTLPLVVARVSLVVEFQISRVFWLVDILATVYVVAALAETPMRTGTMATALVGVLLTVSTVRGLYVGLIEHPERALFALTPPPSPWEDTMQWIAGQPLSVHILADQGHSWKYGTSVRVTGGRDVFLEEVKDSALAIYSRDVAVRVVERMHAIGDFTALTADRARTLSAQYDLDMLVTEADLPLPLVYRNSQFRVYGLKPTAPGR